MAAAWAADGVVRADSIPIENPSFEAPAHADGGGAHGSVPGWTASFVEGSQYFGVFNPTDTYFTLSSDPGSGVPHGKQLVWLNGVGTLTQTLTATVQPNTDYVLRVSVGDNKEYVVGGYAVELRAGGQLLGSASPRPVNDLWVVATVRYRALPGDPRLGQPLTIVLRKQATVFADQVDFDDVQLEANPIADFPVSDELVAHWKFDETEGRIARDVSGRHDGQLTASGAAFVAAGVSGGALQLDRTQNGMVAVPHIPEIATTDFSIVLWTKLTAGDTTPTTIPIGQHETWYNNGTMVLLNASSGWGATGKASYFVQTGFDNVRSTTTINDGQWHQIVATHKQGGPMSIYVDGAPVEDTQPSVPIADRQAPLLMGGLYGIEVTAIPKGAYTGWIDDVQLYRQALDDAQVDLLFHNPGKNLADLDQSVRITPNGGEFVGTINVTLTTVQAGATIRYTLDGTEPLITSPVYEQPLTLTATTTVTARLFVGEAPAAEIASATFTKLPSVSIQPPGGLFTNSVPVALINNLGLGSLFYTTDGSEPGLASPPYTGPVTVTNTLTLQTRVFFNGFPVSEVVAATFTRAADILFTPTPGLFTNSVEVVIQNTLGLGVARYTLDGTAPTAQSPAYTKPIRLTAAATVQAQLFLDSFPISAVFEGSYERVYTANDGIPDAWQEQYFGPGYQTDPRAAADADPDGDAANNAQEYAAGTHPLDPLSGFTVGVRAVPLISWASVVGQKYRILRKPAVTDPSWTTVVDNYVATNTPSQYVDLEAEGVQFYVIEVVP